MKVFNNIEFKGTQQPNINNELGVFNNDLIFNKAGVNATVLDDSNTGNSKYIVPYVCGESTNTPGYMTFGNSSSDIGVVIPESSQIHSAYVTLTDAAVTTATYQILVNDVLITSVDISSGSNVGSTININHSLSVNDTVTVNISNNGGSNGSAVFVFYIEYNVSNKVYKGDKGDTGEAGYSGFDYLFGSGTPSGALGQDGDVYTDNLTGDFYRKDSGSWDFQLNLVGLSDTYITQSESYVCERNSGQNSNGTYFGFGNGADNSVGIRLLRDGTLTAFSVASLLSITNGTFDILINGVSATSLIFTGTGGANKNLNISVSEGDLISVLIVDNGGISTTILTALFTIEYQVPINGLRGEKGDTGDSGQDGYSGFDYLFGSGVPSGALGQDGDVYTNNLTGDFYRKDSGSWSSQLNIKGPAGFTADYIRLTNTVSTNANSGIDATMTNIDTGSVETSNPTLYGVFNDGITVLSSGTYIIYANLYYESIIERVNVGIQFALNNTKFGSISGSSYIRSEDDHNQASTNLTEIIQLNVNDKISILLSRLANSGTVTMPADTSTIQIIKIN